MQLTRILQASCSKVILNPFEMKFFVLDVLVLSAVFISSAGATEIKEVFADGLQLIETGRSNYALSRREFSSGNLVSLSVNGNELTTFDADCHKTVKEMGQLDEERNMLSSAKNAILMGGSTASRFSSTVYTESRVTSHVARNFSSSSLSEALNGYYKTGALFLDGSILMHSDETFSINGRAVPSDTLRVFVNGDLVTWVEETGRVEMRPKKCLDPEDRELVEEVCSGLRAAYGTEDRQDVEEGQELSQDQQNDVSEEQQQLGEQEAEQIGQQAEEHKRQEPEKRFGAEAEQQERPQQQVLERENRTNSWFPEKARRFTNQMSRMFQENLNRFHF